MQRIYKILSIDESGKASFKHQSKLFILCGVIISERLKEKLEIKFRKLKLKFFKNEAVVFHSRDMGRKKGLFSNLRDQKIEISFWSDFIGLLNDSEISFIFIVTEKTKAKKAGWSQEAILKKSYTRLLELFLTYLTKDQSNGKIIAESDPSQDLQLIKAHVAQQAQSQSYRNAVTSISLVSKSNLDADIQIADALASVAGLVSSNVKIKGRAENVKIRLIERKLLDKTNPSYLENLL